MDDERSRTDENRFIATLARLLPGVSGLLIALVGLYFTHLYNAQQLRVAELQTIASFMPHLLGDEEAKQLALLSISTLGNTELAAELAQRSPSVGATGALTSIAATGSGEDRARAETALREVTRRRDELVRQMFASDKPTRVAATTELVRNWSADPGALGDAIRAAAAQPGNKSGVINALVYLRTAPPTVLAQFEAELVALFDAVRDNGPQTAGLVAELAARIATGAAPDER